MGRRLVHGSSIGQEELSESEFRTRLEDDGSVTVEPWMLDVEPPPLGNRLRDDPSHLSPVRSST